MEAADLEHKIKNELRQLVLAEITRANMLHRPHFVTQHEAESVLREELEEAEEQVNFVRDRYNRVWAGVKNRLDNEYQDARLQEVVIYAVNAAYELLQVAAVAHKYTALLSAPKEA